MLLKRFAVCLIFKVRSVQSLERPGVADPADHKYEIILFFNARKYTTNWVNLYKYQKYPARFVIQLYKQSVTKFVIG